uniref:Uncharacterized protein n=1 Tax=Arundo donax TaxID=35708 RepID=A0A0A9C313_ARUDO
MFQTYLITKAQHTYDNLSKSCMLGCTIMLHDASIICSCDDFIPDQQIINFNRRNR